MNKTILSQHKYKAYSEYKNTHLGWLTQVPKHWEVKRLKYLGNAIIGLTYSPDDVVDSAEKGTLVLRSSNVQNKQLAYDDNVYVNKIIPDHLKTQLGDILICARNGSRALIGKNAQIDEGAVDMSFGAFMSIFRSPYNNYLSKVFNSALFEYQSGSFLTATINQLTTANLNSFEIPLPPSDERETIANFLDHETAKIDTLIDKQQQLIKLLKEKRQAVISHAVTKGLNPDAVMKDSGVEWLGEVPAHWKVSRIKYITTLFEQGWSPQCDTRPAESNEYGVLKVGCVNYGRFRSQENKALPNELEPRLQYLIKKGDLLISRANTKELVGSAAVIDIDVSNIILCDKLYRLRLVSSVLPDLLSLYLSIPSVREQIELGATGASHSMQNITQDTIKELHCLIPPLDEAQDLLNLITESISKFDETLSKSEHQIELLKERRTALISAAVTGKIDVRHWQAPTENQKQATEVSA